MPLNPGTTLGPYEIVGLLGAGGMGEVYRARDSRLGRQIAIKVLPAELASSPERLARFEREARTVAGLSHPNVVTLFSVEREAGVHFLTMELVEGQSLDRQIQPGGLPLRLLVDVSIALADALVATHAQGVVHRDLKPGNVMLTTDGRVKVLDFGLARLTAPEPEPGMQPGASKTDLHSGEGLVMGTVPYMSPEQIRGEALDARSDLFSLGTILYELLTGQQPFRGASLADVTSSILRDAPTSILSLRPDAPADLVRIAGRCLEKDPERRVQTAKDVRNELEMVRRTMDSDALIATSPGAAAPASRSIAVLPFENRGRDEEDEYFADGITEDVIAQLCKVRTLKVISRTSVMPFKRHQESLSTIAAKLQVAHLLEGSVRRVGDRVRIVAQLVDPISGHNLWAETYDRRLTDIFAIQTEVALHIAGALQAELTANERERIRHEPTQDVQAYELYLRGRQCLVRYTREELHRSIEYFDRAVARDPEFAPAHVGLAMAYTELAEHGVLDREQAAARALAAGARAVELDPELGDAHCARAYARLIFELDWSAAEAGYRRALELSPGNAFAYDLYGRMCAGLQRFDEAIAMHERAHELDPLTQRVDLGTSLLRAGRNEDAARVLTRALQMDPGDARLHATFGWALFRQGRVQEGIAELERATELEPSEDIWQAQLGEAYGWAGESDKARAVLRKLQDPARSEPVSPYHLAYVHAGLREVERALDYLEEAAERASGAVYGIKGSFLFESLRAHPRFTALLRRLNLA